MTVIWSSRRLTAPNAGTMVSGNTIYLQKLLLCLGEATVVQSYLFVSVPHNYIYKESSMVMASAQMRNTAALPLNCIGHSH